jgi:hypothetical protein
VLTQDSLKTDYIVGGGATAFILPNYAPSTLNRIPQRRLAIQFVVADLSDQMSPHYCANHRKCESPKLGLTAELLPLAGSSQCSICTMLV